MKFVDVKTGVTLETTNEFVIEQYKKNTDRYKEVKAKAEPKGKQDK